jgi:thymidylate synthase
MNNNADRQYKELVEHILHFGNDKADRTGTGTKSIFGWQIRHRMSEGFPLLTTKKMYFKGIVTELIWFLRGDTNIKYLLENDCHIWDGDAFRNYCTTKIEKTQTGEIHTSTSGHYGLVTKEEFINKIKTDDEFAKQWGDLGPVYGKQWRSWNNYTVKPGLVSLGNGMYNQNYWDIDKPIDQIANIINDLKTNPDSRRMMVNAWNVGELDQMVLPPCHYGFQVYTRELSFEERYIIWYKSKDNLVKNVANWFDYKNTITHEWLNNRNIPSRSISLMWNQRSVDVGLGLPFNIASYALLLEIIAKEINMIPEDLIGNLGDCHIYNNHVDGLKEQITRVPYELPKLSIANLLCGENWKCYEPRHINILNYQSHPAIKLPLSN